MKTKSLTLTFEQVENHFHKWAHIFQNNMFEHWELINSAWLEGKVRFLPQSKIKFASYRIRCDMIDYMRFTLKSRRRKKRERRGKHFPYINNFSDMYKNNGCNTIHPIKFEDMLKAKNIDIERKDLIHFLTNHSSLTMREKLIMKLMYIGGYCQREAGEVCGMTESRVSQIHTNIMMRLRALDYSKVI